MRIRLARTYGGALAALLAMAGASWTYGQSAKGIKLDRESLREFLSPIFAQTMATEHILGAAIAVVKDGQLLLSEGYGIADLENQTPVTPNKTIFRIGSTSKVVTALGIVQLADRGLVNLDDDVNQYLVGLEVDDRFPEPVSFSHLLTHTGGFDQPGVNRNFSDPSQRPTLVDFLNRDLRRIRPPGRESCYDTYGIALAGYLLESVSGLDYGRYMRRNIFEPLGMSRTYVETSAQLQEDLAVGYSYADGQYIPQQYEYYASTPASSIDSTVTDMAKLMIAILGDGSNNHGRLFSPNSAHLVKQPQFRSHRLFPGFAYGFWEAFRNGQRVIQHGGTMRGYSGMLYLVPEHNLGVYVACNRDSETGPPTQLVDFVARRLMDRWFPVADEQSAPVPSEPLNIDTARFAGLYIPNLYCHTCYEGEGWPPSDRFTKIDSVRPGVIKSPSREYYAAEPLLFVDESGEYKIAFSEDAQGRVTGYTFNLTSPGSTSEKLDDRLLDEVLGATWRDQPSAPLVGIVHRAHEQWEEAVSVYDAIAADRPDGAISKALALFRASEGYLRLGQSSATIQRAARARGIALQVAEGDDELSNQRAVQLARRTVFVELAAHTVVGDHDSAFDLLGHAMEQFDLTATDAVDDLSSNPLFANLLDDSRFAQLKVKAQRERFGPALTDDQLQRYVGRYEIKPLGLRVRMLARDGYLINREEGEESESIPLRNLGGHSFQLFEDTVLVFKIEGDRAVGFTVKSGDRTMVGERIDDSGEGDGS